MNRKEHDRGRQVKILSILILSVACGILPFRSAAYEVTTHELLTQKAVDSVRPELDEKLRQGLGLTSGITEQFFDGTSGFRKSGVGWLVKGSRTEDDIPRPVYHFHDPLKPLNDAGLFGMSLSSVLWSSLDADDQEAFLKIPLLNKENWSWNDARKYFLKALTEPSAGDRETNFALTFQAIGHVMHLIQDASVPAHVRDDAHLIACQAVFFLGLPIICHPDTDAFHPWAEQNSQFISGLGVEKPASSLLLFPLLKLIDTDIYDGTNPDSTVTLASGVAEFANANFFSDDTILKNYPHPNSADLSPLASDPQYRSLSRNGGAFTIEHVARESVLSVDSLTINDDAVFEDYARKLIPRAIGYSATLLEYFFRGLLQITGSSQGGSVSLTVKNESNEAMSNGSSSIYYEASNGTRQKAADFPLTSVLPGGDSVSLPSFARPSDFAVGKEDEFIVVFQGTLGLEVGAIAVGNLQILDLAFASDRTGRFQVWTVQPGAPTATLRQVTTAGSGNQESRAPDWSARTNKIVYQFGTQPVRGIHQINPDGTDDIRLTFSGSDEQNPSWSPDGQSIAYSRLVQGDFDLWIHELNHICLFGQDYPLVSLSGTQEVRAAWSPDGTKIAFTTSFSGPDADIAVVQLSRNPLNGCLAASNLTPLTDNSFFDTDPTWSQDGAQIAFSSNRNGNQDIYRMNAEHGESDAANFVRLTTHAAADRNPAWSPDGATIAFVSERDGNREIYLMSAVDGEANVDQLVRITDDPATDDDPAWEH